MEGRRWRWVASEAALALAPAAAALLLWLPHRARHLSTWDSVLFALAMERYDVGDARPHAPGYPVYIAAARLVRPFAPDENAALVTLSLLMGAAAVALLYVLLRRWCGRWQAVGGAALFASAPALAQNAVIATSYAGEALLAILTALAALRLRDQPGVGRAAVLGATFGLALGFRQSMLFYHAPLVAWALWAVRAPGAAPHPAAATWQQRVRHAGAAAGAGALVVLAWAVPMVLLSGGLSKYLAATSLQTRWVVFAHTVFQDGAAAWHDHWDRLRFFLEPETRWVLPAVVALAVLALVARVASLRRRGAAGNPPRSGRLVHAAAFLLLWAGPALAFYLLVFNGWERGPVGYVLVLLPAVAAGVALLAQGVADAFRAWPPLAVAGQALGVVLLLAPVPGLLSGWPAPIEAEVADHDAWVDSWQQIDAAFPATDSAIVASYSWAHVKWHHPDHILWSYLGIPASDLGPAWALTMQTQHHGDDTGFYDAHFRGPDGTRHPVPAHIKRIVVYDFQLAGESGSPRLLADDVEVQVAHMPDGWRVLWFATDGRPTIEDYFSHPGNTPWLDPPFD